MIKNLIYAFFIILILTACTSQADSISFPTPISLAPTSLVTSTPILTKTNQHFTSTLSPLETPTIMSSITPTFDFTSVITRTSAPPEKCPKLSNVAPPDLSVDPNNFSFSFSPREEKVVDYLNAGGNPSDVIVAVRQTWRRREIFMKNEILRDLTGDGVLEILIIPSDLYIFSCQNGVYKTLFQHVNDAVTMNGIEQQLVIVEDMNLNGIPEIVFAIFGCGGMGAGQCLDVYVYEWNGTQFVSLIPKWEGYEVGVSIIGGRMDDFLPNVNIRDSDNNGTLELILTGGIPSIWYLEHFSQYPSRDKSHIYTWNGQNFVFYKTEYSAPIYRYQAVQDGDRATLNQEYDKALTFYQDTIFNEKLLGWSPAHKKRYVSLHQYTWDPAYQLTPTPIVPPDDPQEYPNLAAYARYRVMLLHILQGNLLEAKIVYDTLQEKFPNGSDGHKFTLIAKAFWDEYQINSSIESACQKAISYTKSHLEILNMLGSDYHNYWQDTIYQPNDVCPFQ